LVVFTSTKPRLSYSLGSCALSAFICSAAVQLNELPYSKTAMAGKAGIFKKQPTHWPTASFLIIKLFQAFCALLVLMIMSFFIFHLKQDKYQVPWQFLTIEALAALTFLDVLILGTLFCCGALNPLIALIAEAILSLLWAFGAGILGKGMGGNTVRSCGVWRTHQGMVVCHLFKTSFAFCILGWFAMLCGVILASAVRRRASFHKYQPANPTSLSQKTTYTPQTGIGQTSLPYGQGGTYKPQDSNPTYA